MIKYAKYFYDVDSMPEITRQALVPYSAHQMYQLVCDIEYYPEFIPHCANAKILSKSTEEVVAMLVLDAGPFAKSFTTRNQLQQDRRLLMNLEDGPFKYLNGEWHFTQLGTDGCRVDFQLQFEFTSKLVSLAFGKIFSSMAEKMFDAFLNRASERF